MKYPSKDVQRKEKSKSFSPQFLGCNFRKNIIMLKIWCQFHITLFIYTHMFQNANFSQLVIQRSFSS